MVDFPHAGRARPAPPYVDFRFRSPAYNRFGKRLADLALGLVITVLALPVILLVLLVASLDGHAPLFGHVRIGRGGRPFRCFKVRTMVPDAAERLAHLLATDPEAAAEWRAHQKLRHDPRVTRVGRILRVTCLDELPQLWNVLRGDMSLVGPRPVTAEELERYGEVRDLVLSVRPGITGLWQVEGRGAVGYDERVRMDAAYVTSISPRTDLRILLRTVRAVLSGTGT